MFYDLSSLCNDFLLLQYFRMELMNAEKQRKEKKAFEQAKMDLVGQLNLVKITHLWITHLNAEFQGICLNGLFENSLVKGFVHVLCPC